MAYIYGTVAGLLAVALEAIYTRTPSYVDRLWIIVPTSLAISWCIYQLVRASPSIVSAVVVFTAVTLPARVGFALWLGQAPRHPRAISLARVPLLERPFVSDDCPTADGASGPAGGGFAPIQPHRSAGRTHHARAMR